MGMNIHSDSRSGRFGRRSGYRPMAEINVTPFVDVMLVLLIVFMVTAPLLTAGVKIELPKTQAGPVSGKDEPITVSVDRQGSIFIQETAIELPELQAKLSIITKNNPEVRVFVRGDKDVDYGTVMRVMGAINAAGYKKVALITLQDTTSAGQNQ